MSIANSITPQRFQEIQDEIWQRLQQQNPKASQGRSYDKFSDALEIQSDQPEVIMSAGSQSDYKSANVKSTWSSYLPRTKSGWLKTAATATAIAATAALTYYASTSPSSVPPLKSSFAQSLHFTRPSFASSSYFNDTLSNALQGASSFISQVPSKTASAIFTAKPYASSFMSGVNSTAQGVWRGMSSVANFAVGEDLDDSHFKYSPYESGW